ncbi:hypothetical protein [Streptomyces goshikiensis]
MLLQTRRGSLIQGRFPDLAAAAVERLPNGLVLAGELLVWDPAEGRLSFEALQRRAAARARDAPARAAQAPVYFVTHRRAEGLARPLRHRVFTVLAAMSGMEREYIRDRTLEAHESARKRGKTVGGAGVTDESILSMALHLREQEMSLTSSPSSA